MRERERFAQFSRVPDPPEGYTWEDISYVIGGYGWKARFIDLEGHNAPTCIDCHMARVAKSALGDTERLRGDIPSHLFGINPFSLEQFYENEEGQLFSNGFITVPYACTSCHYEDGIGGPRSLQELFDFAQGYHDRDRAGDVGPVIEE